MSAHRHELDPNRTPLRSSVTRAERPKTQVPPAGATTTMRADSPSNQGE